VSALGHWLGGHSFAERGKVLAEWFFATVFVSFVFAAATTFLCCVARDEIK
jgi:hypothetical protein